MYQLHTKMYTKRVSEHTLLCKKRTLDEMLGLFDEPNTQSKYAKHKQCIEPGCAKFAKGKSGRCVKHGGERKFCIEPGCTKLAQGKSGRCKGHGGEKGRKRCIEPGCTKLAQGKSGRCTGHGGEKGRKRCIEPGCTTLATGKSGRCMKHGGERTEKKRCIEPGCTKYAQGKSGRCKGHGGKKKLCIEPGCTECAQGKSWRCVKHIREKKLCIEPGCAKHAQGKSGRCVKHGGEIERKRCIEPGCTKLVTGRRCVKHGGGKKLCIEPGCTKRARDTSKKCVEHGGGLRCPECIDQVVSRQGNPYYDGMCATCFKHKFPTHPKSKVRYNRMKELAVQKAINENFEGFIHDKLLYSRCDCPMLRRIDHRTVIEGTLFAIETDEYAHRGYDRKDEVNRYHDLFMKYGGKMLFIRFNPDGKDMSLKQKIEELIAEMRTQIRRIKAGDNQELLEVVYKFYPQDRKPCFR